MRLGAATKARNYTVVFALPAVHASRGSTTLMYLTPPNTPTERKPPNDIPVYQDLSPQRWSLLRLPTMACRVSLPVHSRVRPRLQVHIRSRRPRRYKLGSRLRKHERAEAVVGMVV